MADVTRILQQMADGDPRAAEQLLPAVYGELRRIARSHMAQERVGHTLQATALVHEAYLRLVKEGSPQWAGRRHFFAAAAEAMRRILIEHARARNAQKRGGDKLRVALEEGAVEIAAPCDNVEDLLALDEALERFTQVAPERAEIVKLLYFAGLSLDEAAAVLGMSRTSAYRQWQFARAWLHDAMQGTPRPAGHS